MQLINNKSGFTLLETVLYIALLAILIGGGMIAVYNILEGAGRTRQAMYREQEAYFITRKIDAVISEATNISLSSPDTLVAQTDNGPVTVGIFGEQIYLTRGGTQNFLNDVLVPATSLTFSEEEVLDENDQPIDNLTIISTDFTLVDDNHPYHTSNYYYENK